MRRLRALLRSDSGELFAESLVSLVVIGTIGVAAAGLYLPAGAAASNAAQTTTRTIMLKTLISESLPTLESVGRDPVTIHGTVSGKEIPVSIWRENLDGVDVITGSVSRSFGAGVDRCTGPETAEDNECISARLPVPGQGIDVAELVLSPGTGDTVFTATVPAGVAEVRYIFKATAGSSGAAGVFSSGAAGNVRVDIDPGAPGYYFGRLLVDAGSEISFSGSGGALFDTDTFMIYEAPRA